MTQRSIYAGTNPNVIIRAGGSVTVKGHASDVLIAKTTGMWGLNVEKRSEREIARSRAAIGNHVLFDIRLKRPKWGEKDQSDEVIEVQLNGSGEVLVPLDSDIKIYAGQDIDVQNTKGQVDAFSGSKLNIEGVRCLGNASSGWTMNIDCQTMSAEDITLSAGSDLRFHVADLTSARLHVKDIGGYWEARIGDGKKTVHLKSGGDVTLVSDQKVEPLPPDYILGNIESSAPA